MRRRPSCRRSARGSRRRLDDELAEPLDRRLARRRRRRDSYGELRDGSLEALVALVDPQLVGHQRRQVRHPQPRLLRRRGTASAARPRPRRGARPRSAPCRRSGRRRSSEPERMSRRASLVSSTLGCRCVRLRIQAASSRACACERPAWVISMRSRRVSARVARGGSKRRATSSRQPVSFDHERSVTLRFGSRASSPGSEWRPERSPVESTTTRVANDQQASTSGSQRSGSRRSSRNTGRSGSRRLAIRLGSAAPSSPAARCHELAAQLALAARRARRDDLGARVERAARRARPAR